MHSEIFKKIVAKSITKSIPLQASLELTYRCNERCSHCYVEKFWDDPSKILSKKDWIKILYELREAGTLYLILMGGEPTLSPYFFDIIKKGTELGFHVSIISNGLKINSYEYAKKMKNVGLKLVTFSLYSLDESIHDKITRVPGSHKKLLNSIDFCKSLNIDVSINSLLTEANAIGLFDLYNWASDNGFELKIDPNITPKLNGDMSPTLYRASKETLLWFFRERSRRWENSIPSPSLETTNDYICNAAKGKCAVNPYGDLLPCIEIRQSMGNLIQKHFHEIWNSKDAQKWRTPRISQLKENDMNLYQFCEHCPGMAKNEIDDPFKITPYTKLIAEVKKQVYEEFKSS